MRQQPERQRIAEQYAPLLVLWPEIPAAGADGGDIRSQHVRQRVHSATRSIAGAHVTRDFHPRDVRLILTHVQAWEPETPLLFVPARFTRLYREYARFFFWPFAGMVILTLLAVGLAQGVGGFAQTGIEVGALVIIGVLYLITFRSPILVPVDNWHHFNHATLGVGLVLTWAAAFGTQQIWYVGPIIAIPTALGFLTSVVIGIVRGLANVAVDLLQTTRRLALTLVGRRPRKRPSGETVRRLFHGVREPHEYSGKGELFFRHPRTGKPLHREDRPAHWSSYADILAHGDYPITYYARVMEPDEEGFTVLQYWFCYYYNDWANAHEGDWEAATVLLKDGTPIGVACSQHEAGEYREWAHVETRGNRPVLYVAAGSHALYFESGAYLTERAVAGLRVTSLDAELLGRDVLDFIDFPPHSKDEADVIDGARVVVIPDPEPETGLWDHHDHGPACDGVCEHNLEWMNFAGHWGAVSPILSGGSGPRGPAFAGLPWDNPRMWIEVVCVPCRTCEKSRNTAHASKEPS